MACAQTRLAIFDSGLADDEKALIQDADRGLFIAWHQANPFIGAPRARDKFRKRLMFMMLPAGVIQVFVKNDHRASNDPIL